MAGIRVIHDRVGETLTIYWADPTPDQVCEEAGDGVILIKNRTTQEVIGFARLYFKSEESLEPVTLETVESANR